MRASRWPGRPNDRGWIDPWLAKIEEWVDRSEGMVRADVVHERLAGLGFIGDERIIRRAVAGGQGGLASWTAAEVSAVDHRAGPGDLQSQS